MSIFKSTFKQYLIDQLKQRQDVRSKENRTTSDIVYLNGKTSWCRMTSTVDIIPDSYLAKYFRVSGKELAKKYILQGGTLYNKPNTSEFALRRGIGSNGGAYGSNELGGRTELGIRPMPGITSLSIKSKSAYGSLREATVNFQCWNIKQLEELEVLYMRPGFTVLIEWGWSMYLDNTGKLNTIPLTPYNIIDSEPSKNQIFKDIYGTKGRVEQSVGNYDAIFGYVKNFTWTARVDGGYDCVTEIITIGEILESLKINYSSLNFEFATNDLKQNKDKVTETYKNNKFEGILTYIKAKLTEINVGRVGVNTYSYTDNNETINTEYILQRFTFKNQNNANSSTNKDSQVYIPLRFLVFLLNRFIILQDVKNKKPFIQISVDDSDGNPLECQAHFRQVSIDPNVCLTTPNDNLPLKGDIVLAPDFLENIENKYFVAGNSRRGIIGNIFLNIDNLIITLNDLASNNDEGKNVVDLESFLSAILSQVQSSMGNINNFDLHVDSESDVVRIVDLQYLEDEKRKTDPSKTALIEIFGTKSTVRNYNIASSIFPEQSTIIAISAQAGGGQLGYNNSGLIKFNEGLRDRIIPIKDEESGTNNTEAELIEAREKAIDNFNKSRKSISEYFKSMNKGIVNTNEIDSIKTALHDIIMYETSTSDDDKDKFKPIIPIKLSITMDGISGIVIGQIFLIPKDRLPIAYKDDGDKHKIGFIVTGISHDIQANDWTTTIDAQFTILND